MINGSPKGDYSITIQTVLYLQKTFPSCDFTILNVGQRIKAYEKNMDGAVAAILAADVLLFAYPVYTFVAPYQLHRFIERLKEQSVRLTDHYAVQLTTSKHFYDVTAHKYIEQNCYDLGLKYLGGLSADMDDLLTEQGREDAVSFWKFMLTCMDYDLYKTAPGCVTKPVVAYRACLSPVEKRMGFDPVIVTNCQPDDESLQQMIMDFKAVFPYATRVINIADYPFSGGCLGCFNCAADGKCVYKDGFDLFLREQIQTADAMIYAFSIKDHSMGASFKQYDDRQFCNGHRTVTMGKPVGYLVNGDYAAEFNLQMILEGRSEVGHQFLAGVATSADEIRKLSHTLDYALTNKLLLPQNFLGVGGMKIFRDLIYVMRGLMKADHQFYQEHGIYDFPQKKIGTILKMKLVGWLATNRKLKAKMGNRMNEGMIAPYQKVIKLQEIAVKADSHCQASKA